MAIPLRGGGTSNLNPEEFHNLLNAGSWKQDDGMPFIQCCCGCLDNGYLYSAGIEAGVLKMYEFQSSSEYTLFAQTQLNQLSGETSDYYNLSRYDRVLDIIYDYDVNDGGNTLYMVLGSAESGVAVIKYRTYTDYFQLMYRFDYADFRNEYNNGIFLFHMQDGTYGKQISSRNGIGFAYYDNYSQSTVREYYGNSSNISSDNIAVSDYICARAFDGLYQGLYACYNGDNNTVYVYRGGTDGTYVQYKASVLGCTINIIEPGVYYVIYKRLDNYSTDVQITKIVPNASSSVYSETSIKYMDGLGCRAHKIIKDSNKYYLLGMGDVSYIWEIQDLDSFTLGDPVELPYLANAYNLRDDGFIENFGLYYLFENYNAPFSYRPSLPLYNEAYNVFMKVKN